MTSSGDLQTWRKWTPINIDGYRPRVVNETGGGRGDANNIYFMGVSVNPAVDVSSPTLLAILPVVDPSAKKLSLRSSICITFSLDGVHWSALQPLLPSAANGVRTMDQNAIGIHAAGSKLYFFVQADVGGIAVPGLPPRLSRYKMDLALLSTLTQGAIRSLEASAAGAGVAIS